MFFRRELNQRKVSIKTVFGEGKGEKRPYRREVCKSSQIMARYDSPLAPEHLLVIKTIAVN